MYARVLTSGLYGISGEPTWVEADTENGLPAFLMVGLANQSIKEARERVHSAILNCGYRFPDKRITVNLIPAGRKKEGSHYDLPMALGVLLASGQLKAGMDMSSAAFLGELTLDGRLVSTEGVLPMVIGLQRRGINRVLVPLSNSAEAGLVKGMEIIAAESLAEAADFISGFGIPERFIAAGFAEAKDDPAAADFSDIRGQQAVKRASQIAAAGRHGLLMIGPPGVGKSMVGKRITGIMPPLSYEEQLEVTQIYSVAGELKADRPMITKRPFRSPHHGMSAAALTGGGRLPRPGEVSLSHRGVLFLDELPEFPSNVLETLRQPLEDGEISISRAGGRCTYPAGFMLVAAMNPCRCGYFGDSSRRCSCTQSDRKRYVSRISGPLLDRIDLNVVMERVEYSDMAGGPCSPSEAENTGSAELREGVYRAFAMQEKRYEGLGIKSNSELPPPLIDRFCGLSGGGRRIMERAFERYGLSVRSYHRVLKVARTAADICGSEAIEEEHLLEALSYRLPEKFFK